MGGVSALPDVCLIRPSEFCGRKAMKLPKALIIVALLWISNQTSAAPGCRQYGGLYVAHYQKAMIGHTFLNRSPTSRVRCMILCSRQRRCLSFNHENTSGTCQLNSERKEQFPESLHHSVGFIYFGGLKPRSQGIELTTTDEQVSACSAKGGDK